MRTSPASEHLPKHFPKHLLLVKLTSIGDVLHTMPSVRALASAYPSMRITWAVEEAIAPLVSKLVASKLANPKLSGVHILALPIRKHRSLKKLPALFKMLSNAKKRLRQSPPDCVIDAQGLLKSALVARYLCMGAPIHGYDAHNTRERAASWFYHQGHNLSVSMHAAKRTHALLEHALNTKLDFKAHQSPLWDASFSLDAPLESFLNALDSKPVCLLAQGSAWTSKQYPEAHAQSLAAMLTQAGYHVLIPHHGKDEYARAQRIAGETPDENRDEKDHKKSTKKSTKKSSKKTNPAKLCPFGYVLAPMNLESLLGLVSRVDLVVAPDTGILHMAQMCKTPSISLFGATSSDRSGIFYGKNLEAGEYCSPCFQRRCPRNEARPPCMDNLLPQHVMKNIQSLDIHLDPKSPSQKVIHGQ